MSQSPLTFHPQVMKIRKISVAEALGYLRDSESTVTSIRSRPHPKAVLSEQRGRRSTQITGS